MSDPFEARAPQTTPRGFQYRVGGAQIAATSIVHDDVPPGARWGGTPAKPVKLWFREMMLLERMAREAATGEADARSREAPGRKE